MSGNMESNDANFKPEGRSADFGNQPFTAEDQREVFKRAGKDVGGLRIEEANSADKGSRKMDPPHGWYEHSKSGSYGLPSEAAISGGVNHVLYSGWRKLQS